MLQLKYTVYSNQRENHPRMLISTFSLELYFHYDLNISLMVTNYTWHVIFTFYGNIFYTLKKHHWGQGDSSAVRGHACKTCCPEFNSPATRVKPDSSLQRQETGAHIHTYIHRQKKKKIRNYCNILEQCSLFFS